MIKKWLLITSVMTVGVCELGITTIPGYSASTTNKAHSACLQAVAKVVGTDASKLSVYKAKETPKGVEVQVTVPGAEKKWLCTVGKDGKVIRGSVMFGGEG